MKTKIKLLVISLFLATTINAQYNWSGLTPSNSNYSVLYVYDVVFDSLNHPYLVGEDNTTGNVDLFHFNGSTWENYNTYAGKMAIDKNGVLWVCDGLQILGYFNTATNTIVGLPVDPLLTGHFARDHLAVDNSNRKWVLTNEAYPTTSLSSYVSSYDGNSWAIYDSTVTGIYSSTTYPYTTALKILAANNTSSIYVIGTTGYVSKFDGTSWTKLDSTNSNLISGLEFMDAAIDGNDNMWILAWSNSAAQNYLIMYDGLQFYQYSLPTSLAASGMVLTNLTLDSTNNVWCKSTQDKLLKFGGNIWSMFNSVTEAGITCPEDAIMVVDKKNNIWIGDNIDTGWSTYPITIFNENGLQTIFGNVYKDANANGIRDTNENGLTHEMIYTSDGMHALTDTSGNYGVFFLDSSSTVTINHSLKKYRYHSTVPTSYSINPLTQTTTGNDFGVAEMPNVNDLNIHSYFFCTRPGFITWAGIDYENRGTTTLSDTITLQLDGRYTFLNSNPSPVLINGGKYQWLFNNLTPLSSGHISLNLRVDSTAVIGDTLFSIASINPIVGDTVPADNMDFIFKVVSGSYDPNEKEVEPKGTGPNGNIPNGETLNYTIHFQNTGTDTAFTVTVQDTLSSNLDVNTFQITGSSHPVITELEGTGNLKFTFYNILLPDSNTNLAMSEGYVSYKIKAINNLPLGSQIENTGYIYFDFNAPVITNTTLNTIANTTGISLLKNDYSATIFPNPIQNSSTLEINGKNVSTNLSIKLYDAMGREMKVAVSKMDNNHFAIHRTDLTSGLYYYQVCDDAIVISSGKIAVQ